MDHFTIQWGIFSCLLPTLFPLLLSLPTFFELGEALYITSLSAGAVCPPIASFLGVCTSLLYSLWLSDVVSHGSSQRWCKAQEESQASGILPLSEEGQVKAGCDEHWCSSQSDEGNLFNRGMQILGEKADLWQSQLDTIKDVENLFPPPENLVAGNCTSLEERLKEAVVWEKSPEYSNGNYPVPREEKPHVGNFEKSRTIWYGKANRRKKSDSVTYFIGGYKDSQTRDIFLNKPLNLKTWGHFAVYRGNILQTSQLNFFVMHMCGS